MSTADTGTHREPGRPNPGGASANPGSGAVRLWVRLLCLCALGFSGYLLYGSLTGERLPGCGLESGCDTVLRTRWAYLFGIPVSLPAVLMYAAVIGATFLRGEPARFFLTLAGATLVSAVAYFVWLQLGVIGAICKFCMASHMAGLVAGVLLLRAAFVRVAGRGLSTVLPAVIGVLLVGFMGVAQSLSKERTFAVTAAPGLAERKAPRLLQLHDGLFPIDLSETPIHGSPESPAVLVHIFDYTCPHCRQLHPLLKRALRELDGQIAVAGLLAPLATNCNRYLKRPIAAHTNACELAYASLALWRSDRSKLEEFETFLFESAQAPSPEAARALAMKLVGTNQFEKAMADPWIPAHLARNLDLYATNHYRFKKSILPQTMIGTNIVVGSPATIQDLYGLIAAQYDVRVPAPTNPAPAAAPKAAH